MRCELKPAALTIYQIRESQEILIDALVQSKQEQGVIELDLVQVADFDGAGLQLLLALACSAKARGQLVSLLNMPACVERILQEFDVANRFIIVRPGVPA